MSILTDNKIRPANLATPEQRQHRLKAVAANIISTARETFNRLIRVQRKGIDILWENDTFTPQEIIDELGDSAPAIFAMHGGLSDFITILAASNDIEVDLKQPTNSFEVVDGKIIVSPDPYA